MNTQNFKQSAIITLPFAGISLLIGGLFYGAVWPISWLMAALYDAMIASGLAYNSVGFEVVLLAASFVAPRFFFQFWI